MKFRMFFGAVKTACIALVIAIGVAVIILDSVMLSGAVSALTTSNTALAWASLVAGAIITVFAVLMLFNSYYKFDDDEFAVVFGVFVDRIEYDEVEEIFVTVDEYEIFLSYRRAGKAPANLRLYLSPTRRKEMLAELEKKCAFAVVHYIQPPAEKDKDDKNK